MNRLDETQKDATGKGLSDSGYKTESNANGSSDVIEADYEEICKALAPSISPDEYRKVTKNIDAQTVEKDLFLQRILLNEALLPLRIVLPEGTPKTGLLLKNFKELTQKHPAVIAFYLPCLEIYRHRSERSKFRDLLNEAKTNCAGIIGIQRACERIDARYFSKSTIISLNAESTINSLRAYTTDARSDVRRSVFTSARHLTQPSTESEGSNPIKIRKTEVENSIMSPAACELKQTPIQAPKGLEFRKSTTPEKQEEVKLAVPKIRDPVDEKENIEVSRKSRPSVKQEFKVPVQTPRLNAISSNSTSHTPQHSHSQQPARQTKRVQIKDKTYQILDKLGEGGFSKVYKCLDNHHGMCALKFVDLAKVDKANLNGIKNEIHHLEKLQGKPNIIQLYGHDIRDSRNLFIILEYGELDFQKYISRHPKLSSTDIKFFWKQMVTAVGVVHDCGIIHRDLKPCNFVIVQGEIKLIDFGIANSIDVDVTSMASDMIGTLNYMSPEQLKETETGSKVVKVGKWTDTWSLGCILYLMAYATLPFQHFKNQLMKIAKICDESYSIEIPTHECLEIMPMLRMCLNRSAKSRPLPNEILSSFFYSENMSEKLKHVHSYMEDEELQKLYKLVT